MTPHRILIGAASAAALLTATQLALAADIPVKTYPRGPAIAPAMPYYYNWSGFYVGGHAGWATGSAETVLPGGSLDIDGWFLGAQVGYNWQAYGSPWVIGGELDGAFSSIEGSEPAGPGTATSEVQWLATARLRAGFALDRWLPYITAGVAAVHNELTVSATVPPFVVSTSDDGTHFGWTAGVGVEWAFAPRWSAKLEYLYYDLGSETYFQNVGGGFDADGTLHTVKVGLNYRFN